MLTGAYITSHITFSLLTLLFFFSLDVFTFFATNDVTKREIIRYFTVNHSTFLKMLHVVAPQMIYQSYRHISNFNWLPGEIERIFPFSVLKINVEVDTRYIGFVFRIFNVKGLVYFVIKLKGLLSITLTLISGLSITVFTNTDSKYSFFIVKSFLIVTYQYEGIGLHLHLQQIYYTGYNLRYYIHAPCRR